MQDLHALLAPLALSLLSAPAGEQALRFAPAPEASHALTFETERELAGGELTVVMNGEEVPTMYLPELDLLESEHRLVSLVESHAWDGPDHTCTRRYDELVWENEGTFEMTMAETSERYPWRVDAASPLEGRTVEFTSEDGLAYEARVVDDHAEHVTPAEGLEADLSLRQLLPAEAIAVGATWRVDGERLGWLHDPAGDASWELPEDAAPYMRCEILSRAHEGELEVRLDALEDGLARCTLQGELVRVTVAPGDLSMVPVVDGTATDTTEEAWEAGGTLVWDVERNRVARLELYGELSSRTTTVRDPDQPGSTYESVFRASGTYEVLVTGADADEGVVEVGVAR